MSKPIRLTEELKNSAIAEFVESVSKMKMADGRINYNKSFTYKDDEKATIYFTPVAYAKMLGLLMSFSSEVAWHGVGERLESASGAEFLITDILVYPQTVSGTTVEMDTEEYAKWLMDNIDDDRFNHIIMQGHSHVNMGCTPSGVDSNHQEQILEQLTDDMFYIFMIWNKRLENNTKIYDLANNTLYENKDITYGIYSNEVDLEQFTTEAKAMVKSKTYSYPQGGYCSNVQQSLPGKTTPSATTPSAQSATEGKSKSKQKGNSNVGSGWGGRGYDDMEDEALGYGYPNHNRNGYY